LVLSLAHNENRLPYVAALSEALYATILSC